jgi:hypothetical protein
VFRPGVSSVTRPILAARGKDRSLDHCPSRRRVKEKCSTRALCIQQQGQRSSPHAAGSGYLRPQTGTHTEYDDVPCIMDCRSPAITLSEHSRPVHASERRSNMTWVNSVYDRQSSPGGAYETSASVPIYMLGFGVPTGWALEMAPYTSYPSLSGAEANSSRAPLDFCSGPFVAEWRDVIPKC